MNRRDFLKTSAAVTATTAVLGSKAFAQGTGALYERSVHFVYAINSGKTIDNSDSALQTAFGQVTGGVTCLCPFFLNVLDPASDSDYTNMLNWVTANGVTLVPAVGLTAAGNTLNNSTNVAIAKGYFQLGTHIRLENLSGYFQNPGGEADVKGFINECISIGFTNIMLNPWPIDASGNYMSFNSTQLANIDSAFQSVNPNTWEINPTVVSTINGLDSSMKILVNYESPGPQSTIAAMTVANQKATFTTTINDLETYPVSDHLHWAPPFTQSYDPLDPGTNTWNFIVTQLDSF